ncbi:MAG TPA: hypothetical protein EYQ50_25025 [Verrucomicrobiales bacterium]|nr:hypothetical protein [Verrucomicrobiales bacterium]
MKATNYTFTVLSIFWGILLALFLTSIRGLPAQDTKLNFKKSLIKIEVTKKRYNYMQPWSKQSKKILKTGIVIDSDQILTTAQGMSDMTLVRAQREGRGRWRSATVKMVDYHANLAILTVEDAEFKSGLEPVTFASVPSAGKEFEIIRWLGSKLETSKAYFSRYVVAHGNLSFVPYLQLVATSEISGVGWGEPLVSDGTLHGILAAKTGDSASVIPASFIRRILNSTDTGNFRKLGYFDFTWQPGENPTNLEFLNVPEDQSGVVVVHIPLKKQTSSTLKTGDVILKVAGHAVDSQGDYLDEDYGHLMFENLATQGHWAGDAIPILISRNGELLEIQYTLASANYSDQLVPDRVFDREPEFLIAGGLVFQPLNNEFLRTWGNDWQRRAPMRLVYFNNEEPTEQTPSLVVLSQILPADYNIGYENYRFLVVEKINGKHIVNLTQLKEAFATKENKFHLIEFRKGDALERLVLDAAGLETATQQILQMYGISSAERIYEN